MEQLEVELSGRVQGVFFRHKLVDIASKLELTGYVENKSSGILFILAQGERSELSHFLLWIQKGSELTKIDGMRYEYKKVEIQFTGFNLKGKELRDNLRSLKNLTKEVLTNNTVQVPKHIGVIPDGNRRWAREKGWHAWVGHVYASNEKRLQKLFVEAQRLGVSYMTIWLFSTDNWKRDNKEVTVLINLFRKFIDDIAQKCINDEIRFRHLGRRDRLPADIISKITELEEKTKSYNKFNIQIAMDYGGRDELIRTFNKIKADNIENIDELIVRSHLDSGSDIPDVDLIIRTSGEQRTSGMLLWQSDYAELYFSDVYFPDFTATHLRLAVLDYSYRVRRFGANSKSDKENIEQLGVPQLKEYLEFS